MSIRIIGIDVAYPEGRALCEEIEGHEYEHIDQFRECLGVEACKYFVFSSRLEEFTRDCNDEVFCADDVWISYVYLKNGQFKDLIG